jgi:propionate CoA-transferase
VKAHRIMHGNKVMSANAALALVKDGDTIGLIGGGGGLMEASALFAAIERRFLASGHPRVALSPMPSA